MQKINGSSWLKTISILVGLISPFVSLICPFIAFKLDFRSASKLEKEKKEAEQEKIKKSVDNELSHELEVLKEGISIFYKMIIEWNLFLTGKTRNEPPLFSRGEYRFLSFDKYGVDYFCLLDFDDKEKIKNIISGYEILNLELSSLRKNKNEYSETTEETNALDIIKIKRNYVDSICMALYRQISLSLYIKDLLFKTDNKKIITGEIEADYLNKEMEKEFKLVGLSMKEINDIKINISNAFNHMESELKI